MDGGKDDGFVVHVELEAGGHAILRCVGGMRGERKGECLRIYCGGRGKVRVRKMVYGDMLHGKWDLGTGSELQVNRGGKGLCGKEWVDA
jgi:hypothetical protein